MSEDIIVEKGLGLELQSWSNAQVHSSRGGARGKGGARGGGRGRSAAAAVSTDDLTESEKSAVSKAGRERARRERLNDRCGHMQDQADDNRERNSLGGVELNLPNSV